MMLFYDNQFVYLANWNNLLISVYTPLDSNQAMVTQIVDDLKVSFAQLQEEVEKIN